MNIPRLTLVKEQKLNKDFSPAEEMVKSLYISSDGVTAWLSYVDSIEEVYDLIAPDNILELLSGTLSEEEYNSFEFLMESGSTYTFYDETYTVA